jgi:hypothetical protein
MAMNIWLPQSVGKFLDNERLAAFQNQLSSMKKIMFN